MIVGQMIVGQMIVGQMIIGQMIVGQIIVSLQQVQQPLPKTSLQTLLLIHQPMLSTLMLNLIPPRLVSPSLGWFSMLSLTWPPSLAT